MMRWLFRPTMLLALAAAAVVGAFLITWASGVFLSRAGPVAPTPLPVAEGDHEVVWLYPATNSTSWERFAAAVRRAAERLQGALPGVQAQVGPDAFPRHTTAVPEVALALPGGGGRLVFRWYKLTSDSKTRDWIEALVRRRPAPLAIIGGSSSDAARELAGHLQELTVGLPEPDRPLLLLTTATANRVLADPDDPAGFRLPAGALPLPEPEPEETPGVRLTELYPGRTFRFCFSNAQMAAAVTRFLWTQDDLRPDADPVYMVRWDDDAYSRDLIEGFWKALRALVAETAAGQWAWVSGGLAGGGPLGLGGGPFPVYRAGRHASSFSMALLPTPHVIDSSVGSFAAPNRFEAKVARDLADQLSPQEEGGLFVTPHPRPRQERPLLVLTGQSQPSRRFLRALEGYAPYPARHFVVATGDGISFNTVYRDRQALWRIEELPFPLVFFCHRNPIDRDAGFRPLAEAASQGSGGTAVTGTEDVLLDEDILEALALAQARPVASAGELAGRLHDTRLAADGRIGADPSGVLLFNERGGRRSGTGEHVVCLRPRVLKVQRAGSAAAERVLPEATIEVWAWRRDPGGAAGGHWQRVGEPLVVTYDDFRAEGGSPHGVD
jgi:hypothetical protein